MSQDSLQWLRLAAAAAVLVAIVAFGWLGTCARPAGDDYIWIIGPPVSAMARVVIEYREWSPRYTATFFMASLTPFGPRMIAALPAAALGLWLIGLLALFRALPGNRGAANGVEPWDASLLAAAATLWGTVDSTLSSHSLYWASAMFDYTASLVALTFLAAWIVSRSGRPSAPSWASCTLAALAAFLCGGFSDTTLALQGTAFAMALFLSYTGAVDRSLRRILLVGFVATAASALVFVLCPGNVYRWVNIGPHPKPTEAGRVLWYVLLLAGRFFIWKPGTALSVFAAGWLSATWNRSENPGVAVLRRRMACYLLSAAALMTMSLLPVVCVYIGFPPNRLLNVPQFILVLAVFSCGASAGSVAWPETSRIRVFRLLAYTLLIAAPLWSVWETFQTHANAAQYAALWDRRDQRLRAEARAHRLDVTLDPLPEDLSLLPGIPDGSGWSLDYIEMYYGLPRVRAEVREAEDPWLHESWTSLIVPASALYQAETAIHQTGTAIHDTLHDTWRRVAPESLRVAIRKIRGL